MTTSRSHVRDFRPESLRPFQDGDDHCRKWSVRSSGCRATSSVSPRLPRQPAKWV